MDPVLMGKSRLSENRNGRPACTPRASKQSRSGIKEPPWGSGRLHFLVSGPLRQRPPADWPVAACASGPDALQVTAGVIEEMPGATRVVCKLDAAIAII